MSEVMLYVGGMVGVLSMVLFFLGSSFLFSRVALNPLVAQILTKLSSICFWLLSETLSGRFLHL